MSPTATVAHGTHENMVMHGDLRVPLRMTVNEPRPVVGHRHADQAAGTVAPAERRVMGRARADL